MAKTAVAAVVDDVLATTLKPSLKAMGFRKQARHWHHDADGVYRGVTVQMRTMSSAEEASFTIELGVSYADLGHPPVAKPMGAYAAQVRERVPQLRSGWDHWYGFSAAHDEDPIGDLTGRVTADWSAVAVPFLEAASDPRSLCELALEGQLFFAARVREAVARPLGDADLERALLRHELDLLRVGDIGTPLDNPSRDLHLLRAWRRELEVAAELAVPIEPADRAAAVDVVRRVAEDHRPLMRDDRNDLDEVVAALRQS